MSEMDNIEIQEAEAVETPKKTYVALVVDESSSMGIMYEQAISLFNENLQTLKTEGKKNNIETFVSVIKFASDVNVLHKNINVNEVEELDKDSYQPCGMTAMYDGIGTAINIFRDIPNVENDDVSFLILTITDGVENASKEFNGGQLSSWIKELEETDKWTFTVLGANIDLQKLRKDIGIQIDNVQSFNFNQEGFVNAASVMNRGVGEYMSARSRGVTRSASFYADPNDANHISRTQVEDALLNLNPDGDNS